MQLIKIAAATVNQTPLDWTGNLANIRAVLAESRHRGVTVCCLPELCITGYGCEDAYHSHGILERAGSLLKDLLPDTRGMVVSFGLPLLYHNAVFNTAALVADGQLLGFVAKRYLAGDGIHYEPRWFKPWENNVRTEIDWHGRAYPLGDLYFDVNGIKIGFEICEDAWVGDRPGAQLARQGVDIILNPSASHFAFGKFEVRKRFIQEGSRAFGVSYVYANLLGNESGRAIFDGGAIIASGGRLLAEGSRFSFRSWQLTTAVIDVDSTRTVQARTHSFRPDLAEEPNARTQVDFRFPPIELEPVVPGASSWERSSHLKEEEFTRCVTLALFDYMRKSRSKGFVVSLSGGADSTAVACLVSTMVELAAKEIGLAAFAAKVPYLPALAACADEKAMVKVLLTTAYQATPNSSDTTRNAARTIAEAVGAEFHELWVGDLVESYASMIEKAIGRPLTWQTDDVTLQNIQARVRAPGVWMLANIKGALLLATSNRSEVAVGYATMDGDTCGGLSPIAGIDKAFVREWLRWLETDGPDGLHPIPAVRVVNVLAPTAELQPSGMGQTDEKDLMPYPLLDAIERAAIRDKRLPLEVYREMRVRFRDLTDAELVLYIERFFRLWCRNQWKRERYAPSFHLDDESLDPKTWCRFPILSGGYEVELQELRDAVLPKVDG